VEGCFVKQVLRTDDRDRAASFIAEMYLPIEIDVSPGERIEMGVEAVRLQALTAGVISTNRQMRIYSSEHAENFHVNVPVRGRVQCRTEEREPRWTTPGQASLFLPGEKPDTAWSPGTVQMCLMVPRSLVESGMDELGGHRPRSPFRPGSVVDLSTGVGRAWRDLLVLLARDISDAGAFVLQPVARRHFERLVVDGLLLIHQQDHASSVPERDASVRAAVAKAAALVDEAPAASWSSVALANRVHVSVRSLQEGFRRELGTSPMSHVQTVRLRRVRADLLRARGTGVTVAQVAARWGFAHMGRFAAAYRRQFSELPSATLKG
jgi:AraC-like DNA-binding protein